MQELKYLKTEGEYALLESEDGTLFRVLIEDLTRKPVKSKTSTDSQAALSPREIQLEIRAGLGVAELAAKTGVSIEYIEKFAAPVIDELAHVVQSALSTRITVAGDKYSETIHVEFGEVIASRLANSGYAAGVWSSRKVDNNIWQVSCAVEDSIAIWVFDPKKLTLSPENELAVTLSTQQTMTDGPIPKLRSVINTANTQDPAAEVRTAPPSAFTTAPAPVPTPPAEVEVEVVAQSNQAEPTQTEAAQTSTGNTRDLGSTLEFEGVIPFGRQKQTEPVEPTMGEDLANTADLLEALRRKRQERESAAAQDHPFVPQEETVSEPVTAISFNNRDETAGDVAEGLIDDEIETAVIADGKLEELDLQQTQPLEDIEKPSSTAKKGRTSVPKWDEIVFGSAKSDDEN